MENGENFPKIIIVRDKIADHISREMFKGL